MKTALKNLALFLFVIASMAVNAQEWTKAQLEIWKTVENEWSFWKTGDISGMSAILHDKYQGWSDEDPLPTDKAAVIDHFTMMKDAVSIQSMSINPARIVVTDNAAVVDYYFSFSYTYGTINEQKDGRIVEFYTKEGGKWLLIGDMMVFDEDEDDD